MHFRHFGLDYASRLQHIPEAERATLGITAQAIPFNPAVTGNGDSIRLGFFGLNAYCDEHDMADAARQRNFIEWCQGSYRANLFNVLEMYRQRMAPSAGMIYYSNVVKAVLDKKRFKGAQGTMNALNACPDARRLFAEWTREEIRTVRSRGCQVIVCFGMDAFKLVAPVARDLGVCVRRERHFSRYWKHHTRSIIDTLPW